MLHQLICLLTLQLGFLDKKVLRHIISVHQMTMEPRFLFNLKRKERVQKNMLPTGTNVILKIFLHLTLPLISSTKPAQKKTLPLFKVFSKNCRTQDIFMNQKSPNSIVITIKSFFQTDM